MYKEIILILLIITIIYFVYIYDSRIDFLADDGKKYKIFDTKNNELNKKKANILSSLNKKAHKIINYMYDNKLPSKEIADISKKRFMNCIIGEILEKEGGGYTISKGSKIGICLVTKGKLNDENDAYFVTLHELAHVMSNSYGHGDEFKLNFNFIVKLAIKLKLWKSKNYNVEPVDYCGIKVTTTPCTDGTCTKDNLDYYFKESLLAYK